MSKNKNSFIVYLKNMLPFSPKRKINKLYIHIGTDKTGSTSIQHFCNEQREMLLEYGIAYPPGARHAELGSLFASDSTKYVLNLEQNISDTETIRQRDEKYLSELYIWVNGQKRLKNMILSYEGYYYLDGAGLLEMKNFAESIAKDYKLVLYIRKPLSYSVSAMSQKIKMGIDDKNLPVLDHAQSLKQLIEIFGKDRLILRVYQRDLLLCNDIVEDFFDAVGMHKEYRSISLKNEQKKIQSNRSITMEGVIFGKLFIAALKKHNMMPSSRREFRLHYGEHISRISGRRIGLMQNQLDSILERSKESRTYIEGEFGASMQEESSKFLIEEIGTDPKMLEYFDLLFDLIARHEVHHD